MKKTSQYYVNNKDFDEALAQYVYSYRDWESGQTSVKPQWNRYIQECVYKIVQGASKNFRYRNYSYREEMIADALFDCARYLHKFNPDLGFKGYSYVSMIASNAFIRKIKSEKKHSYIKHKMIEKTFTGDVTDGISFMDGDSTKYSLRNIEAIQIQSDASYLKSFVEGLEKKAQKKEVEQDDEEGLF